jgi:hypothetical protein
MWHSRSAVRKSAALDNPIHDRTGHDKDHWFHGSHHEFPEFEENDGVSDDADHYGASHWNTLLGHHFTSDHQVAADFAEGHHASASNMNEEAEAGRVIHAKLHIKNPKVYKSEHDMDQEVHEFEHARGNTIDSHLPPPEEHADDDEWQDHYEDMGKARYYGNDSKAPWSKDEPDPAVPYGFHPKATGWLNTHPDKDGIARRFKQRLEDAGHDGIVYGNEYEDSHFGKSAVSAVAFHPHQIEIHHDHTVNQNCKKPEEIGREPGKDQPTLPGMDRFDRKRPYHPRPGVWTGPTTFQDPKIWRGASQAVSARPSLSQNVSGRLGTPLPAECWERYYATFPAQHTAATYPYRATVQGRTGYEDVERSIEGPLYHGGRANLGPGDEIVAGRKPNPWGDGKGHVYFSTDHDTALDYAHQLGGKGHLYEVEPTGEFSHDRSGTDFKSKHPLRVIRKIERDEWPGWAKTSAMTPERRAEIERIREERKNRRRVRPNADALSSFFTPIPKEELEAQRQRVEPKPERIDDRAYSLNDVSKHYGWEGFDSHEIEHLVHKPEQAQFSLEHVPVKSLRFTDEHGGLSPTTSYQDIAGQGEEEQERLHGLQRGYDEGANVPPIVVVRHGDHHIIADGAHRAAVHAERGDTHIPAFVTERTIMPKQAAKTAAEYGDPTDWDTHYNPATEIHRGMFTKVPYGLYDKLHGAAPKEEAAAALLNHTGKRKNVGMHWSADLDQARDFGSPRTTMSCQVPVVLHGQVPGREAIETRPSMLRRNEVFPHDHREREIPLRKGSDVDVFGISWKPDKPHPEADKDGWVRHDFTAPTPHTAAKYKTYYHGTAEEAPIDDQGYSPELRPKGDGVHLHPDEQTAWHHAINQWSKRPWGRSFPHVYSVSTHENDLSDAEPTSGGGIKVNKPLVAGTIAYDHEKHPPIRTPHEQGEILYHGTSHHHDDDDTEFEDHEAYEHIAPAAQTGSGPTFASNIASPHHAYASYSPHDAWHYADTHSMETGGVPHVYRVTPTNPEHLEPDPQEDEHGRRRGNRTHDMRSKSGFDVLGEVPMDHVRREYHTPEPEEQDDDDDWGSHFGVKIANDQLSLFDAEPTGRQRSPKDEWQQKMIDKHSPKPEAEPDEDHDEDDGRECRACGERHGDEETTERHESSWTDWDAVHPHLNDTVHRVLKPLDLPSHVHDVVHDESRPMHERARALLDHINNEHGDNIGMHWSDQRDGENGADKFAGYGGPDDGTTQVMMHAKLPEKRHIETDPEELERNEVISYGGHDESEVPISYGAPVHVSGVSWRPGGHGQQWRRHDLKEPMTMTAKKRLPTLRQVIAHDATENQAIRHCPFCGSGKVLGRGDGSVECEFCHGFFTVQVQPQFPNYPQTIGGVPQQIPGMPGQVETPASGGALPPGQDPNDPNAQGGFPPGQDGGDDGGDGDDGGNPFAKGDDEQDGGGDDPPPFAKKSFLTVAGACLAEEDYVRHLALAAAPDRMVMLAHIREEYDTL